MNIQPSVYTPNYSIGPYFQIGGTSLSFSIGTAGIAIGLGGQVSVGAALSGTSAIGWDWSGNSSMQPSVMAGIGVPTGIPGPTGSLVSTFDGLSQQLQLGIGLTDIAEVGLSITRTQPDRWSTYPNETSNESARLEKHPSPWDSYPDQTPNETGRLDPDAPAPTPDQTPNETARLERQPSPWGGYPDATDNEMNRLREYPLPETSTLKEKADEDGPEEESDPSEQMALAAQIQSSIAQSALALWEQSASKASSALAQAASASSALAPIAAAFSASLTQTSNVLSDMAAQAEAAMKALNAYSGTQAGANAGSGLSYLAMAHATSDFNPYAYAGAKLPNPFEQLAATSVM